MVAQRTRLPVMRSRMGQSQFRGKTTLASVMNRMLPADAAAPALRAKGMPDHLGRRTTSTRARSRDHEYTSSNFRQQSSEEQSSTSTICNGNLHERPATIDSTAAVRRSPSLRTGMTTLMNGVSGNVVTLTIHAQKDHACGFLAPLLSAVAGTVPSTAIVPVTATNDNTPTRAVCFFPVGFAFLHGSKELSSDRVTLDAAGVLRLNNPETAVPNPESVFHCCSLMPAALATTFGSFTSVTRDLTDSGFCMICPTMAFRSLIPCPLR